MRSVTKKPKTHKRSSPVKTFVQIKIINKPIIVEVMSKLGKQYTWVASVPRPSDKHHNFSVRIGAKDSAPSSRVDLRDACPPIYNQGELGSCTANAICGAYQYDVNKQGEPEFAPSRLFLYYNERSIDGTIKEDVGSSLKTGIDAVTQQGVCEEVMWPYDVKKYNVKPSDDCYENALKHQSIESMRVTQNLEQLKQCLINGFPFVFGFTVYESFESENVSKTAMMPMPNVKTEKMLGGHAVMAVGYDDNLKVFIVRNSWGEDWGAKGYFYMPYAYIVNSRYCDDFWTITKVE